MSLEEEIRKESKEIATDGYDMSIGELINLYQDKELIINPAYQRYFRWNISQKTRFMESILLGIPIPSIFVFTTETGTWELVDGLQRLSTIFEFVGILKKDSGQYYEPSTLEGTKLLPSLAGKRWEPRSEDGDDDLTVSQRIAIKRARMRVEILKKESDPQTKYELFQRLNTGGSPLTEQEVRNCVLLMMNKDFYHWFMNLPEFSSFRTTISQTEKAEKEQYPVELALRFFVYRHIPYEKGLNVHEYISNGMMKLAVDKDFDDSTEESTFKETFRIIERAMRDKAFKRYSRSSFSGKFLISVYEVLAVGVAKNLASIQELSESEQKEFIEQKARELWEEPTFVNYSGAGVSGSSRLANLLPLAGKFLKP